MGWIMRGCPVVGLSVAVGPGVARRTGRKEFHWDVRVLRCQLRTVPGVSCHGVCPGSACGFGGSASLLVNRL
jgi:hypothetical protein